jgi:myo-inositol-1-phosphate synthase
LNFYHKRVWLEEQNRDVKTVFKGRGMRLLRAIRFEHLGGLRGLALAMPQKNSLSKSVSLDAIKMAEKGMVQKGGDLA